MKKKNENYGKWIVFCVIILYILSKCNSGIENKFFEKTNSPDTLYILSSYENQTASKDVEKYAKKIRTADYESLPYYLRSIEFVNIGAFPLLPKENSGVLLKNFLKRIIVDDDIHEQLDYSIPQKGLYYSFGDEVDNVIYGCYKSPKHLEWIQNNMKYNLRLDKGRKGSVSLSNDFTHSKYLVLYGKGDKESKLIYGIVGDSWSLTIQNLVGIYI